MHLIVVGQGYVGLPLAINAAKAGFTVYGFDIDKGKVNKLKLGITESPEVTKADLIDLQSSGKIEFTSTIPKLSEPAIFVIAVPTPLNALRKPDLSMLKRACKLISSVAVRGSLIINESTSYIGTLNQLIKPLIESITGLKSLDYAVAPERIDPANTKWSMKTTPRIVAGINEQSTERVLEFYSKLCDQVYVVSNPEVAEAAKLFENTFRQVNIALVNELSHIASQLKFSTHEAINAAATKPYGFMPFYPSIGVGGHCIPVDPNYLKYSADLAGVSTNFINLANEINLAASQNIANRINIAMGGSLIGKKIQVAGIAYKPNVADLRESPALLLIEYLGDLGGIITWHDPLVEHWNNQNSSPLTPNIDLGLILTPHDQIDFSIWKNSNTKVLDLSANSQNYGWPKFL